MELFVNNIQFLQHINNFIKLKKKKKQRKDLTTSCTNNAQEKWLETDNEKLKLW